MSINIKQNYDVVIVGAGPAGCTAAHELGKEFKVLLIDKGEIPQDKPCGGLLCKESIEILTKWKMPKGVLLSPPYHRLGHIALLDWDNNLIFKTKREFWNINRKRFSTWLISRLPPTVSIIPRTIVVDIKMAGNNVEIITNNHNAKIRSKYLIGADGAFSVVRREIVRDKPKTVSLHQVLLKTDNRLGNTSFFIYDRTITPTFYSWVIPKEEGTLIGTKIEKNRDNLKKLLQKISKNLAIKGAIMKKEAHPITLINNVRKEVAYGSANVLLIGEAAGFVDPSSGEGISYALQSGLFAAQSIRSGSDTAVDYQKLCNSIIQKLSLQLHGAKIVFNNEIRKDYLLRGRKNEL